MVCLVCPGCVVPAAAGAALARKTQTRPTPIIAAFNLVGTVIDLILFPRKSDVFGRREAHRHEMVARAEAAAARGEPGSVLLVVETPLGIRYRNIAPATPLASDVDEGPAAEAAAHSAAAQWGLPDFVFRAPVERVGPGVREKGDGLLILGDWGVMLQVKRRSSPTAGEEREVSWVRKKTREATRQAEGSIRRLKMTPTTIENLRGRQLSLDANSVAWLSVIILDHDALPDGITLGEETVTDSPTITLTRRDWEFLFNQLKSAYHVVQYLRRVAGEPVTPLGSEYLRYYDLASADSQAGPRKNDPRFSSEEVEFVSFPLLPQPPAGYGSSPDESNAFLMTRIMLEEVAVMELSDEAQLTESNRIALLGEIDSLPLAFRADIGRALTSWFSDVQAAPDGALHLLSRRIMDTTPGRQLAFAAASILSESFIKAWALRAHRDYKEKLGQDWEGLRTTAVVLTPAPDGPRVWDTTVVSIAGDPTMSDDEWKEIDAALAQGLTVLKRGKPGRLR